MPLHADKPIEWALAYAKRGWPVVPLHTLRPDGNCTCTKAGNCKSPAKHPVTKKGFHSATTDKATIRKWYARFPKANVGIITGTASGLVVLDVDAGEGRDGEDSLNYLSEKHGPLLSTVEGRTGDGGRHIFFAHPGGRIPSKVAIAPGLDVRGDGSFVVAPPSLHASGRRYKWIPERAPGEVGLAPLPPWLIEMLQAPSVTPSGSEDGAPIPEGERNSALASLAGSMRRRGMTEEEILTALLAVNKNRCAPPLDESEVEAIARSIARYSPAGVAGRQTYTTSEQGLTWLRPTKDGTLPVPLTNFTARIVTDIREDDGVEVRHQFEIEAYLNDRKYRFVLPAGRFTGMSWVLEHLGAEALLYPGQSIQDHARAAIQLLSSPIIEHRVYTHLGWRQIGNEWVYIHGAGATGSQGTVPSVEVRLPDPLRLFRLPPPPVGEKLRVAVRASLRLLWTAPPTVTVPILAAIYRAALGTGDFSVHLTGPTGAGKSELAALAQQHYGAGMDSRHLPGSWSSTGNALEGLAFAAKDALLVVDDFAPHGSDQDLHRIHREADRLFRAQGNRSGRLRMRADTSLQPPKPPRGIILSTGEDVPRGQSLRARILVVEIPAGAVNWDVVTKSQQEAAAGLLAAAMAGFIRWAARRHGVLRRVLRQKTLEWRDRAHRKNRHLRAAEMTASLAVALKIMLKFAEEAKAITRKESLTTFRRAWAALLDVAAAQVGHQKASDPVDRFLELVRAAIVSGRAHVADPSGGPPPNPEAWGWRERGSGMNTNHQPMGDRMGWILKNDLYLEPVVSYVVAQRMARDTEDSIAISPQTLRRRLKARGLLRSVEPNRQELTVRRTLEGVRRKVLHISAHDLGLSPNASRPSRPGLNGLDEGSDDNVGL